MELWYLQEFLPFYVHPTDIRNLENSFCVTKPHLSFTIKSKKIRNFLGNRWKSPGNVRVPEVSPHTG